MPLSALIDLLGPRALTRDAAAALDSSRWSDLATEEGPGVWSFPLLSGRGCGALLAEIDRREAEAHGAAGGAERPPNSMHRYGAVLGTLGFGDLLRELRTEVVAPLASLHYADVGGTELDAEYGFLAEYGGDGDDDLGFHVDDSAVTLNLCLGERFSGSELYFRGLRCDEHRQLPPTPNEAFEYVHDVGTVILHAGRQRHGVYPILRGRRRNLILWCQSAAAKEAAESCQPWCGAHG